MASPELTLDGPIGKKISSMRGAARFARKMAVLVLAVTAAVMIAGGRVFYSAGEIVATDRAHILEERNRLTALKEQSEQERVKAEEAKRGAEREKVQARQLQMVAEETLAQAAKVKAEAEKAKAEADKSIAELQRRRSDLKK